MSYINKKNPESRIQNPENQHGLASIVIVSVLVIILTLISVGFARIMDRAAKNSSNNQLASAAYYAARSGISDAGAYLAAYPNTVADTCDDLLGAGPPPKPLQGASDALFDPNTSKGVVKYTCILIDQTPTELNYQKIDPFKSQVVKLAPTSGSISTILLSWQGSNPNNDNKPNLTNLYSQTNWATNKYEPMLRLTVYPVVNDSDLLSAIEGRAKTFFLYPVLAGTTSFPFTQANGSRVATTCNPNPINNDYQCSLSLTSVGSYAYHYLRLTPLYGQADIKIKATTAAGPAKFASAQTVIDVTAKANTTVRRLAARVDTSSVNGIYYLNLAPGDYAMPENAIRSAGALCKRLNVNQAGANPINGVDVSAAVAFCHLTLSP